MNPSLYSTDSIVIQDGLFDQYHRSGDPTSLRCDEFLENSDTMSDHCKCYTSTPSSLSTTSESTSYSRDLYITSRLRSRSEEKNYKSGQFFHVSHSAINYLKLKKLSNKMCPACVPCSCSEDRLRFSMYSEKKDHLNIARKDSKQGEKFKHKENLSLKSSSSVCCSDESDSVPPAMALINVNRLQTHNLHGVALNKNRTTVRNEIIDDFDTEFDVSESKISKSFRNNLRKSLPAIHLDYDLEIGGSSGTSSLSDTAVIDKETEYATPDKCSEVFSLESKKHYLNCLNFGQTGTSARDSGLSSHSSNSVNYSPNSLPLPHKELVSGWKNSLSPTPPPVPNHAPQSLAIAALAQRNEKKYIQDISNAINSAPNETDLTKCSCFKGATTRMGMERIRGTTIRLNSKTGECKTPLKSCFLAEQKQIEQDPNLTLSPIWKRKSNTLQPMIKDNMQLPAQQTQQSQQLQQLHHYSKSVKITKIKKDDDDHDDDAGDGDYANEKNKHLANKIANANTILMKNDTNHNGTNHSDQFLFNHSINQQQQQQHNLCEACILNWQFYLSQPCNYTYIDNLTKCYHNANNAWYFIKHDCFLKSITALFQPDQCFNCRKHIYAVGINLFNRNPLKGLKYLARYHFLNLSSSQEISKFIQNNTDLCRSKIGAFLGLPPTDEINPKEVTMILLQSLNFSGLEADEALRLVVHRFGMPMESQEIDRLLQCIAEYYHTVRWCSTSVNSSNASSTTNNYQTKSLTLPAPTPSPPPITVDQLSLLFYAILLLQTSLHNVNAAKSGLGKQSVSQFIKNVHDLLLSQPPSSPFMTKSKINIPDEMPNENGHMSSILNHNESIMNNDQKTNNNLIHLKQIYSNRILTEIFHRIKMKSLIPGPDQTTIVQHISKAIKNLHEIKILNDDDSTTTNNNHVYNESSLFMSNPFELVETHRRLVCYCTVIHIHQNQLTHKETNILRHMFVFNDLIIIAKDTSSSSSNTISKRNSGRKLIFDKSKQKQSKLSLGQYNDNDTAAADADADDDNFIRPPLDLFYVDGNRKKFKIINNETNKLTCMLEPTVGCVPIISREGSKRRSRSKNEFSSRKLTNSTLNPSYKTRLTVLYAFSLNQCKIRLFKTDVYRYGIEFWRFPKLQTTQKSSVSQQSVNNNNHSNPQPEQVIIIAALDKNDYENLLNDLYEALYETNLVNYELQ
ncbi:unnamed protein product [Schistosoma turkestanicum]|nr:unnamed protein product [Schistosoma turkestanicum]